MSSSTHQCFCFLLKLYTFSAIFTPSQHFYKKIKSSVISYRLTEGKFDLSLLKPRFPEKIAISTFNRKFIVNNY